jgi:hypothetical protein
MLLSKLNNEIIMGVLDIYKNKIRGVEFCKTKIFTFVTEMECENQK